MLYCVHILTKGGLLMLPPRTGNFEIDVSIALYSIAESLEKIAGGQPIKALPTEILNAVDQAIQRVRQGLP